MIIVNYYYIVFFTIVLVLISYLIYYINKVLNSYSSINDIKLDIEKLNLINILQPWIQANIEKSAEFVIQKYMVEVNRNRMSKTIDSEQYLAMIQDIRSNFYGSIPKSVNTNYLFKYIDQKQIDILIISAFRVYNDNFFIIVDSNNNS